MSLESIFHKIAEDLPWAEHTRLVVGPQASRENVKDACLSYLEAQKKTPLLPGQVITVLSELALQILPVEGRQNVRPLSVASQCDALETIISKAWVQKKAPHLTRHMKQRPVTAKVARFLTQLDLFCTNATERDALVEALIEKNPEWGRFVQIITELWDQNQLTPWSGGTTLRRALQLIEEGQSLIPKNIWLWGFVETTPLEKKFIEKLSPRGWRSPETALTSTSYWRPHSLWDELAMLHDSLKNHKGPWHEIAVLTPQDDLYKRVVRNALQSWHVPLHDPTLTGGWRDETLWLWWRDFLRTIQQGLKLTDVRSLLGDQGTVLYEEAYKQGCAGSASQWQKLTSTHPVPAMALLLTGFKFFSKNLTPHDFMQAAQKIAAEAQSLNKDASILIEFAEELVGHRPYLTEFQGRLSRYLPLFEEFLDMRARRETRRHLGGLWFASHEVWIPQYMKTTFLLGSNVLQDEPESVDFWNGEILHILWQKIHGENTRDERRTLRKKYFFEKIKTTNHLVVSQPQYNLNADAWAVSPWLTPPSETKFEKSHGHQAVGWGLGLTENLQTEEVGGPQQILTKIRISEFEDYLKCPFIYYGRHILKLQEEPQLSLDPTAQTRGILIHKILETYLKEEKEESFSLEEGCSFLEKNTKDIMARTPLEGLHRDGVLRQQATRIIEATVLQWWHHEWEQRQNFPTLKPVALEQKVEYELAPGVLLTGRIDRIDSDGKFGVVIDYKSGVPPYTGRDVLSGTAAQLLLYSEGMRQTLQLEPAAAYYLELSRTKVKSSKGFFLKKHQGVFYKINARNHGLVDQNFDDIFELAKPKWITALMALQQGVFTPKPFQGALCQNCSFRHMCGYTES